MSIHFDRQKGAWRFSFKRLINGRTVRATKLLPKAWTRGEAERYDSEETARLYAKHVGLAPHSRPEIEQAVLLYLEEHCHELKTQSDYVEEYARLYPFYKGRHFADLPAVCAEINKLPIAAATRRKKIRMLAAACNYGFKIHGMGSSSPSERVVLPKVKNARTVYPTRREVLLIARKCDNRVTRAAIMTAFYSGMRQGEIRKAQVSDGVFKLFDTKNGSIRFVPIHEKLRPYLKHFPMAVSKSALYWPWKKACRDLNMRHFHFHDIRHSSATAMLNAGADLSTVGEVLGHKDVRSTRIYAHMLTSTMAKAIALIGAKPRKDTPVQHEPVV